MIPHRAILTTTRHFVSSISLSDVTGRGIVNDIRPNPLSCFYSNLCAMVKSRYIRDGHPTFNRSPCNGYINPDPIGLMSLSPIWKSWELIDPIAHIKVRNKNTLEVIVLHPGGRRIVTSATQPDKNHSAPTPLTTQKDREAKDPMAST